MELAVGREEELLAQLRALLFLPSAPPAATPPAVKVESAAGPVPAIITGNSGGGRGPAAAAASSAATAGGSGLRRRRQRSKRDRDDDNSKAKDEQHEEPADAQPHHYSPPPGWKRRKKTKQQTIKSTVTSVPDFDGYQWRKYGQKQIEGAMYPRSYYRCTRSAEQGCQAKRTVQRNNDDGNTAAVPQYTVVYAAEHTCTANDSLEAPVILETTTVVVPSSAAISTTTTTTKKHQPQDDDTTYYTDCIVPTTSAGSCSTATAVSTSITTGTESPAISGDDITCGWSATSGASSNYNYADDYDYFGGLFAAAYGGSPDDTTLPVDASSSSSSLREMEDLTGPIRSPVHVPAAGGWTIDQLLLQLVNEPVCQF